MPLLESDAYRDPCQVLERLEEKGQRCYDCLHGCTRVKCVKNQPGYPNEGRSTCCHFIFEYPNKNSEGEE